MMFKMTDDDWIGLLVVIVMVNWWPEGMMLLLVWRVE